METPLLIALMILGAIVGYLIDLSILFLERRVTRWRFVI
ncbi:MAG: nitrate ABC transporter substrate-binding protein [Eubacteriales bacterium]|nr:nitrate ABC transporter substrate-binding protein [Eubacteriales bacterium]